MKQSFQHGVPIFMGRAKSHDTNKTEILREIFGLPRYGIKAKGINLTSCDWHLKQEEARPYWDAGFKAVENNIAEVCDRLGFNDWDILKRWYQYYEAGDFHSWHVHGASMFVGVYYVKLDVESPVISFRWRQQEIKIPVSEGDVLMFPSYLWHKGEEVSGASKLILSFNCNFSSGQSEEQILNKV